MAVLYAVLVITVVDNSVLMVALPAIAHSLASTTGQLQAVADSYVVVFAGLLVIAGAVADRFGRRRVMLIGLAVFAASSLLAAWSWSVWWLIGMRAGMGAGAALVSPATLATVVRIFPVSERPKVFAGWFAVASAALAVGPVLGGLLISWWSWPAVFLINLPIAVAALIGVVRLVPESRDPEPDPARPGAVAVLTTGLLALVASVIGMGERGWPVLALWGCAAVGVVSLVGFVQYQRRAATPMIDLAWYRNRGFAGGGAAVAVLAVGSGSVLFVLPQYLQLVRGESAFAAGLAVVPLAVGTVLGSVVSGRVPARLGARPAIVTGLLVVTAGFAVLATVTLDSPFSVIGTGLLLVGAGTGFAGPAVTAVVLNAIPAHKTGLGSALNTTHQQLGTALGIAALGSVLATTYRAHLPTHMPAQARGSLSETLAWAADQTHRVELITEAHAAFTRAQATTMLISASCAVAGALIALATLSPSRDTDKQDP